MPFFGRGQSGRHRAVARPASPESGAAVPPAGWARTFSALGIPEFRTLWVGTLFAMASMQMLWVAQPWLAYRISGGSALAIGFIAGAQGVPMFLVSPLGGMLTDRLDKRKVLMVSHASLGLLAVTNTVLVALDVVQIWHLVIMGACQGALFPFTFPTRQAYIPELVKGERMANALALDSAGMGVSRVVAPSVAGVLLSWIPAAAFGASALLSIGAVVLLFRLPPGGVRRAQRQGALGEITQGLRYVWGRPVLVVLIAMGFVPVILGMPFQQFLPVFQSVVLDVGTSALGLMYTAVGVGALFGALAAAYLAESPRKGLLQVVLGLLFGVSIVLFAVSTVYGLSLAFLAVAGFTSQSYLTINRVLLLLDTDREYYGRVMSIYFMTFALNPVTAFPLGALVDAVGAPLTFAGAGGLLAAFVAGISLARPSMWRRQPGGTPPAPPKL